MRLTPTQFLLHIILFLFLLLASIFAKGQAPVFRDFELIKYNDQVQVNDIFQCKKGYLWLGTSEGLFRFDGLEKVNYTEKDSLAEREITSIYQDPISGVYWIGHGNGAISYGTDGHWKPFVPDEGVPASAIADIYIQDSIVWFATLGEGVYYYKDQRLFLIGTDEGLPDNYVYDIESDGQGNLWVGTDGGIGIISPNASGKYDVNIIAYDQGLPDNIVKKLRFNGQSEIWIGMQDAGIAIISIKSKEVKWVSENWEYSAINDMVISENTLWLATERKGLISYSLAGDNNYSLFNRSNGLRHHKIKSLLQDREGNIWLGTASGIVRSPGKQVEFIKQLEDSEDFNVQAIQASINGDIWFSTSSGLFKISQQNQDFGTITKALVNTPYAQLSFISLFEDPYGDLWLGTYGEGLLWFNPGTNQAKLITENDGLVNGNILSITGKGDILWLATLGGAIKATIKPNTGKIAVQNFTEKEGLGSNFIYKAFIDTKDRVWFGTDGKGVSLFENGTFTTYQEESGLKSGVIYSIAEDSIGNIWFSTPDQGIYRFDAQKMLSITEKEGIRDLMINSIITDRKGNLIVFNRLGLDLLNTQTLKLGYLGEEVGFGETEPNLNAVTSDKNGSIWFGTHQGIVKYAPRSSVYQSTAQSLIKEVQLFNKPIERVEGERFSYNENNFTFEYAGLWFTAPEKVNYLIKLENYDLDWIASPNRRVTYSSLPPGEYIFKVKASADQDFDNANEATYSFVVRPPFWKTIWFYIVVVIVGVFGFFGLVRVRERNLRETQRILETKVEERTQEIKMQNEELEAQRDQINDKNAKLESAFTEIHKKNENITSSINYAKRIQRAILPLNEQLESALPEHFILYRPKDIVSGDFYWMSNKGNRIYIAAVDCTGHGVPGAFMSLIGNSLLNEIVDNNEGIRPADILEKMNNGVIRMLKQEELTDESLKSRDGMDLALICIDKEKGVLEYGGAKRPLLLIENGQLEEFKGAKYSIGGQGIGNHEVDFFQHEIALRPGQHFYFFTDGYPDQFSGHNATKFMTKNFKEMLLANHHLDMAPQREKLNDKFVAWQGKAHQTDDVLVIGLKITEQWLKK